MKSATFLAILATAACLPAVAKAQLITERLDGNRRVCTYRGAAGLTTGSDQARVLRISVGENCPYYFPLFDNSRPAPPTAPLSSDRPSDNPNVCIYSQWGQSWAYPAPAQGHCPPAAGMLRAQQREPIGRAEPIDQAASRPRTQPSRPASSQAPH
jgi:hypothetical protein